METELSKKYEELTKLLIEKNITISCMESCTGGLLASLITDTEGASAIMKGSYVTYSNEAKIKCGVNEKVLDIFGVYSTETAGMMALSCKDAYSSSIGVGVTGTFSNKDPENPEGTPGTVYVAIAYDEKIYAHELAVDVKLSRPEAKAYVASKIADLLFDYIKGNQ